MTRTGMTSAVLIVAVLIWTVSPTAQQAQREVQFRKAMETETVKGDFKAAIEQYRQIADGSDRVLAAKALVRMAECYQNLGDAQAKAVYERIVRDFRDQKDAFTLAQSRLSPGGSRSASSGPRTEVVFGGRGDQVSPDGRYISTHQSQNLALREVATGNVLPLQVVKPADIETYPLQSTFSPDGKQLAVEWYYETDFRGRLWVVSASGNVPTQPRVLYDNPDVTGITPFDWSRDGRSIAVQVHRKDRIAQIGVVGVQDGSLRVLRSVEWIGATHMAFSPDGSLLAYDRPGAEGEIERDVFVIAVDGTREIPAVVNPGDDRLVGWSRDGQRLLFRSDRGGTVGLWARAFRSGAPQSTTEFVNDFGNGRSMGLTDAGALYYQVLRGGADVFVAPFDAASGQLSSPPAQFVRQFNGANNNPEWSADGKYLAYLSKRDPLVPSPVTIVISSAETGQVVREIHPKLSYLGYPRWSPDGRTFVARGADLKGRSGIVKFDATTGDASLVVPNDVCSGLPSWSSSPDGTFFCFDFKDGRILQVDVASGAVRRDWRTGGQPWGASPDGRYLVYDDPSLKVLSLATGETRELLHVAGTTKLGNRGTITFTPDSRHVALAATVRGEYGMWLVPVDGGQPRKIAIDAKTISMWRFNAKTWQIAYAPSNAQRTEVRKMENFLPAGSARR
jgi:TolB protein